MVERQLFDGGVLHLCQTGADYVEFRLKDDDDYALSNVRL